METKLDSISANLKKIQELRAKNRKERAKRLSEPSKPLESSFTQSLLPLKQDLDIFLKVEPPPRPVYCPNIITTSFPAAPPPPSRTPTSSFLSTLAVLYPIGVCEGGEWYIISPFLHISEICIPVDVWQSHMTRIRAVIWHCCKLLLLISAEMRRTLPYPIQFYGSRIIIEKNGTKYELTTLQPTHLSTIAFKLLNQDAAVFACIGENSLLPNLYAAIHPSCPVPSERPFKECLTDSVADSSLLSSMMQD